GSRSAMRLRISDSRAAVTSRQLRRCRGSALGRPPGLPDRPGLNRDAVGGPPPPPPAPPRLPGPRHRANHGLFLMTACDTAAMLPPETAETDLQEPAVPPG